jgi:hypothetical protein
MPVSFSAASFQTRTRRSLSNPIRAAPLRTFIPDDALDGSCRTGSAALVTSGSLGQARDQAIRDHADLAAGKHATAAADVRALRGMTEIRYRRIAAASLA